LATAGPGPGSSILVAAFLTVALAGLAFVSRMLGNGTLGPNPLVGFRLRPLLRSEEAWQRGHEAAVRPLTIAAAVGFLALVASVIGSRHVLLYLIFLGIALAVMIVGVILAAVLAVRAAKRV
jgi:hypothetical protein